MGKQLFRGAANAVGVNAFGRYSTIDAVIAAAGIITELPPLQPLDYVLDAMRVSRKLIKTAPVFAPLASLLEPLFLRVVEGLWDAYFKGEVPANGAGYGSIASSSGFGGSNPILAAGGAGARGTIDDIGKMIDRFLGGKLNAGDKDAIIGWVKTLTATSKGVVSGDRKLLDSLNALMGTIESGKVAKSLDHLIAKFGKDNKALLEILVKTRAKSGTDEEFARGIVALAKSLDTPKSLKKVLSSADKASATRKLTAFTKALAQDPDLAATIAMKLGKIESDAAKVVGKGHKVDPTSLGEALGSAIATGTLTSTKSLDEFTGDLAFLTKRMADNPSDASNKTLLKQINDNFKNMAAPGAEHSRPGVIQGRALEIRGLAAMVKKHGQDFDLNRKMPNYPDHLQPTDADVFSRIISKGLNAIGGEAKYSEKSLGSTFTFARKLLAYQAELGTNGKLYLIVPNPGDVFQKGLSKLTNRRAQLHGNTSEAKILDQAIKYFKAQAKEGAELKVDKLF